MSKRIYSLWVISEDGYENNAEFVTSETKRRYLPAAKRLLKSQSVLGKATVLIEIAWKMEGKVHKAIGAEFLHNDQVQSGPMRAYVRRRLRQIGLDDGGLPLRARTRTARIAAIDASEKAFAKKKPPIKKKKKQPATPRTRTTVGDVLARIKATKPVSPCNPDFARRMKVAFTPGVRSSITGTDASNAVQRFIRCDWGDVSRSETLFNNRKTRGQSDGSIRGVYQSRAGREFWVVYEQHDQVAVLLLPEEN